MKRGKVDVPIAISVTFLLLWGLVMVFSASSMMANSKFGSLTYFFRKQMIWGILAFGLMIVVSKMDYRKLVTNSKPVMILGLAIALLAGLYVAGVKVNGARRWYNLVFFNFQPSEFAKLALIIYFAYFLSSRGAKIRTFKTGLAPLMVILITVLLLIMKQPDLSTALMIAVITGSMLFLSRAKLSHIGALILPIVPAVIYIMSTQPYQRERVNAWLGALSEPLQASYQIKQSLIGLGRGGILGQGLGQSKQKFFFLPDSHTDFIFSILGEEFGFIGTTVVLMVFLFILYRGLYIAQRISDSFGKFLTIGITLNIVMYAFINAAVVSMLMPATGLPMPFISYGGSNLIFLGISVGLLMSISRFSTKPATDNWNNYRQNRERLNRTVLTVD